MFTVDHYFYFLFFILYIMDMLFAPHFLKGGRNGKFKEKEEEAWTEAA